MAEKFLHIWKLHPPMRRALKLRRGEDRIVKSTEVMIAAQVKPASAVHFAVLVFSGSGVRRTWF
jgi:ethanolamine utilization microcompartment shell protein EutL